MSREVAGVAVFFNAMGAYTMLMVFPQLFTWLLPPALVQGVQTLAGWVAVVAGPLALYAMNRIYRIKARPFWDLFANKGVQLRCIVCTADERPFLFCAGNREMGDGSHRLVSVCAESGGHRMAGLFCLSRD